MNVGRPGHVVATLLLVSGCAPDVIDVGPDESVDALQPLRDDWRVEVDVPFDAEAVSRISIGGGETADNFANRGDVIVRSDGVPGRIIVEMRRFTFNRASDVERDLESLVLLTHRIEDELRPRDELPPSACDERWDQDCAIRVRYDGQIQVRTGGADLRVTLPPEYEGHVEVVIEDNDEFAYVNTAEVCMLGLRGTTNVEMGSGRAWLSLADDISLVPGCAEEDVVACQEADPAWSFDCPCVQPAGFPISRVQGEAAELVVSIPTDFWAKLVAGSEPPCEQTTDPAPENAPPGSWPDAGYRVEASSRVCDEVAFYESPDHWEDSVEPDREQRGNVDICRDCLRDVTCDDLVR